MVTLVVLDGFGISKNKNGNAISAEGTPYLDKLMATYPSTTLKCSGESVGLPSGQMGNSEVGHMTMGAGKTVLSDYCRISQDIKNGSILSNEVLLKAIENAKLNKSTLHLMGLVSNGGVHSDLNHLKAIIDMAKQSNVDIALHAFLDGRDTPPKSALAFLKQVQKYGVTINSICGRVYAMDRENRWDRINKAYDMLCLGQADNYYQKVESALEASYEGGVTDEFVLPTIIGKPKTINSNDSVIFFNFRTDRVRELTRAITEPNFNHFPLKHLNNLYFVTMVESDATLSNVHIAYPPENIEDNLSALISRAGKKQFHVSETTKYAHVTFFFNGGKEQAYEGEDRKLIESVNVQNFATVPNMKAFEITECVLEQIASNKYDFILVNLSNLDMVGHTGNFEATKQAVRCIDKCVYSIALATTLVGETCIITADHGNAECMIDKLGNPVTSHSTNPVPFILCNDKYKRTKLTPNGSLANIAPTILKLMNLPIPKEMNETLF